MASYYALWHDARRTELRLHTDEQGRVDGFLTLSQTGADLFRLLVTMRARNEAIARELFHASLAPNRPYLVVAPVSLASVAREQMEIERSTLNRIYHLSPSHFQPIVNVLVQQKRGADGSLRFQIESQGQVVATSGTNWRSPVFAEVFVYVHPQGRGRSWGKSVVSACTAALLEQRVQPIYVVEEGNDASVSLAEGLGYRDTGAREFAGEGHTRT